MIWLPEMHLRVGSLQLKEVLPNRFHPRIRKSQITPGTSKLHPIPSIPERMENNSYCCANRKQFWGGNSAPAESKEGAKSKRENLVSNSTCLKTEQMCAGTISFLQVVLEAQPRAGASLFIFGQLARDYRSDFPHIIFSFSLNCVLGHHKTSLFSLHFLSGTYPSLPSMRIISPGK